MTLDSKDTVMGGLDPEVVARVDQARRELLFGSAKKLALFASAPLAFALSAKKAFAQDLPQQVVEVLQFALTLEHIEDAFYRTGLGQDGLIPEQYLGVFRHIGLHESQHVALLESVLGANAVPRPELDLTAGGQYPDVLENFDTFLTLSQTFEDLGVAAYKGQAANLIESDDILNTALRIHSVEARHAAEVRRIGGRPAWDDAFGEALSKEEVLNAAGPFLVNT